MTLTPETDKIIIQSFRDTNPFSLGNEIHLVADESDVERAQAVMAALLDRIEELEGELETWKSDYVSVVADLDGMIESSSRAETALSELSALKAKVEKQREAIAAKKYTKDQGIDQEMRCYNDGLDDALAILDGKEG